MMLAAGLDRFKRVLVKSVRDRSTIHHSQIMLLCFLNTPCQNSGFGIALSAISSGVNTDENNPVIFFRKFPCFH